jgi:hypothetical protein
MSRSVNTRSPATGRAARPAAHAGRGGGEYALGTVELARRVMAVPGGRYSAGERGLVRLDLAHTRCQEGQAWTALR